MTKQTASERATPTGHGGAREGAGRPPSWAAPITGIREDLELLAERVNNVPFVLRLFLAGLVEAIQALASRLARVEFMLAEHLRVMMRTLDRMEHRLEFQEARERAKQAAAIERAAEARAENDMLLAQIADLRKLVAASEEHLSRIRSSVREVPTAVPEKALVAAAQRGVSDAVSDAIRRGALRLPPALQRHHPKPVTPPARPPDRPVEAA